MKIRTDFITNSSSSAFVIIGARLGDNTVDYHQMWKLLDEKGLRFFGEENAIGKVIARLDYDDYGSVTKSLSALASIFEEVKNAFNELGIKEEVYLIADIFST